MKRFLDDSPHGSNVFVLRVWLEELGNGQSEWRGQLQQVSTGELHYFRDWQTMLSYLIEMLPPARTDGNPPV